MGDDVTIREVLVPALAAAFPGAGLCLATPPEPVAVFPAACAEVGAVHIYDDGDEATVYIGNLTHHSTNPYDSEMTPSERAQSVTNEVLEFLRALFEDRVFLWSIRSGEGGGGWQQPYEGVIPEGVPKDADLFVWSRRVKRTGQHAD